MGAGVIDVIFERFASHGDSSYLGEPVTLTEHMLQTALAAEDDGAGPMLVAAALLHDYGHLIHDLPEDSAEHGVDIAGQRGPQQRALHLRQPGRAHLAPGRLLRQPFQRRASGRRRVLRELRRGDARAVAVRARCL